LPLQRLDKGKFGTQRSQVATAASSSSTTTTGHRHRRLLSVLILQLASLARTALVQLRAVHLRRRGMSPPAPLLGLFAINSLCTATVLQLTADTFDDELRASPCAPA
jgi:hypothetical protein